MAKKFILATVLFFGLVAVVVYNLCGSLPEEKASEPKPQHQTITNTGAPVQTAAPVAKVEVETSSPSSNTTPASKAVGVAGDFPPPPTNTPELQEVPNELPLEAGQWSAWVVVPKGYNTKTDPISYDPSEVEWKQVLKCYINSDGKEKTVPLGTTSESPKFRFYSPWKMTMKITKNKI